MILMFRAIAEPLPERHAHFPHATKPPERRFPSRSPPDGRFAARRICFDEQARLLLMPPGLFQRPRNALPLLR